MKAIIGKLTAWDKIVVVSTVLCFVFWVLIKITPNVYDFILLGILYEAGGLVSIGVIILCSLYFLIKWVKNKFTFNTIYIYGFLLGVLTLVIISIVYSII